MTPASTQSLKPRDRLLAVAGLWSERSGRSLGALSTMVMNHGGALARLTDPANSVTDATLERFAVWFLNSDNWPDPQAGLPRVPQEARDFAHILGVDLSVAGHGIRNNAEAGAPSTGQAGHLSGEVLS